MKVKVIKTFKDKHTKKLHRAGEEFTCTKDRYAEIISAGEYVEEIPLPRKTTAKESVE